MTALAVEQGNGRIQKIILRQHAGDQPGQTASSAATEFKLLQILGQLGLPAPKPLCLDQAGQILAAPYLVVEYVAGEMLFAPPHLKDYLHQFAVYLAQIHNINIASVDLDFLPKGETNCLENFTNSKPTGYEEKIRQALNANWPRLQKNRATLLHGDYWPGNVLWLDGKATAVIDWEDAVIGDPLIDLAKSRAEIVWLFGIEAMTLFTRRYQTIMKLDYAHLAYWDLCAFLRLFRLVKGDFSQLAAYAASFGRGDIQTAMIETNLDYFIQQALAHYK